jgi:hypothetical protein
MARFQSTDVFRRYFGRFADVLDGKALLLASLPQIIAKRQFAALSHIFLSGRPLAHTIRDAWPQIKRKWRKSHKGWISLFTQAPWSFLNMR